MSCKLIKLSETSTVIICKFNDNECSIDGNECDSNGPELAFNSRGEYFDVKDRPEWQTDPDSDGYEKWMEEKNITGGCVSCSKCGKPVSPPMF